MEWESFFMFPLYYSTLKLNTRALSYGSDFRKNMSADAKSLSFMTAVNKISRITLIVLLF